MFYEKPFLKNSAKSIGKRLCQSLFSNEVVANFGMGVYLHISNFLHIFRTPFSKNSYGGLLLFFLGRIIIHHHFLFLKKVERTVHIEKNCYLNSFWKYFEYLMCGILWLKYKRYHWKTRPSGLILWISLKCLYRQKQPPEVFYQKRRWS